FMIARPPQNATARQGNQYNGSVVPAHCRSFPDCKGNPMLMQAERDDGKKILINTDHVVWAESVNPATHTRLTLVNGDKLLVKGTLQQIENEYQRITGQTR